MISINYSFPISGGTAPYTCTFSNTNTCATFSSPITTLSNNGTLTQTITYQDENCINNSVIVLTVDDVNGCSETYNVQLNNPCSVTSTPILQQGFNFYSSGSGGTPNYSYNWTFDSDIFTLNDGNPTDGSLNLLYNPSISPVPQTSQIDLEVTDSNGCIDTQSYIVQIETPVLNNLNTVINCSNLNKFNTSYYGTIQLTGTNLTNVDWSTLSISGGTGLQYSSLGNGWIQIGLNNTGGTSVPLQCTVQTFQGITSEIATLTLSLPICISALIVPDTCYMSSTSNVIQLISTDLVTSVKTIDIEDKIFSSEDVDWNTFQFTNTPVYGTVVLNKARQIEYTITSLATPTDIDTIKWSVQNECGTTLNNTEIINRDIIAAPVTVGEFICMTCNNPTVTTDITANDTGDIDKSTIEFTLVPNDVTYIKDADNNFIFTALPDSSLTRTLQYKVANTQGVYSNVSSVLLSVACAGIPNNQDITCWVNKNFNLLDYFVDANAAGYLFAETTVGATTYIGQGGTIGAATGTVDFTTITPGVYTFQLTAQGSASCVGVDDTATIEITVRETPEITLLTNVNNGNDTATITFTAIGVNTGLTVVNNGTAATFSIQPSITSNVGTFTLYLNTGVNNITIQAMSECGTIISDTFIVNN